MRTDSLTYNIEAAGLTAFHGADMVHLYGIRRAGLGFDRFMGGMSGVNRISGRRKVDGARSRALLGNR